MGEPILDQINLVVSDVEATVEFYRRLRLDIPDTDPAFQNHHRSAQLARDIDFDVDSVEFARHWDEGWRSGAAVIGFRLGSREQADAVYMDLTSAGHAGQQEPTTRSGARGTRSSRTPTATPSAS